ncbi:MAG: hypothetical protein ACKVZ0_15625 [Gemmatimonadales bacterium]
MTSRRSLFSLGLLALAAGCSDNTGPTSEPVAGPGPRFLQWAVPALAFTAVGADASGMGGTNGPFFAGAVTAPPAVDRSSSATASKNSLSWSHTVGSGTNRLLVVSASIRGAKNIGQSVTYQGRALTKLSVRNNHDDAVRIEQWYLIAPPSGTGTVTITLSGSAKLVGGAVSVTGADQVNPFYGVVSNGSTDTGILDPTVTTAGQAADLVISAVATEGTAGTSLKPKAGQALAWTRYYGTSGGDVAGGASVRGGSAGLVMGWTKGDKARWAIAAAVIKAVPTVALSQYQATFWAKRGQARTIQINYAANGGTAPFMSLTISDPTFVPGRGNLAVGDSVLVTATVDPNTVTVSLEPHQLQFGTPAQLKIWYGGAGGDLNGDGVVDGNDSNIENQLLGMWYQADPSAPWVPIAASKSLAERSFTAALQHFSGYAISW